MQRTAIGSSGRVGLFYDGRQDCVVKQNKMHTNKISYESEISVCCELINGSTDESQNLLQMIHIDPNLRLNILLNPKERTGMAALIDHPYPINEYTRFLYYTYINRIEQLADTTIECSNLLELLNQETSATHIITGVHWGINLVVVLQLPSAVEKVTAIDNILRKIQAFLKGEQCEQEFSRQDEELLEENVKIHVYSNIPDLRNATSVFTLCQYINGRSKQFQIYRPLKYLLRPIKYVYPQYTSSEVNAVSLPSTLIEKLENYLIRLLDTVKTLKYSFNCTVIDPLRRHLKEQLYETQQLLVDLEKSHKNQTVKLKSLINDIYCGHTDISKIDEALDYHNQTTLNDCIEKLNRNVNELQTKKQLIKSLQEQHFEYCNVAELNMNRNDYEQTLLRKLVTNKGETRILCSNNISNEMDQLKFNQLRDQLVKEYETNRNLHLIYADFSYCSFELPDMIILPSSNMNNNADIQKQCTSSPTTDEIINILLLGETGVGKSTFINAFVNYLVFESLEQAELNKSIVLIPVSFIMTNGDNFEERIVNFRDCDNLKNEDFNHPGQSVTQHCRSYLFNLNHINGKKLRIIDTPGFGDTRGLDQDGINMQHILEYINNLTHLNAICFLLKPNLSRLNIFFRTCLIQLFDLLGSNAHQNIIFCFTNARSTFYTPGDTAPLLKTMLKSLSKDEIPFRKENTFCLDSESFRYLVALRNGIQFSVEEKQEYEMSWSISVKESQRLISYISTQVRTYDLRSERQSIKHAQIEITHTIRPMLEAMRNILRNLVLLNANCQIALRPKITYRPATICSICKVSPVHMDKFLILPDCPHEFVDKCLTCSCASNQHIPIDYILKYELLEHFSNYDRNKFDCMIQQLRKACNVFAYFLIHVARSTKEDPILLGFEQMIIQENYLCQGQDSNYLNSQLIVKLRQLQQRYKQVMNETNTSQAHTELPTIYKWIQFVHTHPEIREQITAIKEGQQILMKEYEYKVPENLIK